MCVAAFKLLILLLMLFTHPLPLYKYKVLSLVPVTNSISFSLLYALLFCSYLRVWKCRIWISDCSHLHWLLNTCCYIYYTYAISINIICTVSICTVSISVTITSAITMYYPLYVFVLFPSASLNYSPDTDDLNHYYYHFFLLMHKMFQMC